MMECDLFNTAAVEQSIWHGLPMGRHGLGLLHYVDPKGAGQAHAVDTSGEICYWPAKHWPALALSTVYAICYDAVNVWWEGEQRGDEGSTLPRPLPGREGGEEARDGRRLVDGGSTLPQPLPKREGGEEGRAGFERCVWRWHPSHLEVAWRCGGIEIAMTAAMVDGDRACVAVAVRNVGSVACDGALLVRGDENWSNCTARGQTWAKQRSAWRWTDDCSAQVDKELDWGLGLEFFPYFANLRPEDRTFEWLTMRYRMAFAVRGEGWRREDGGTTWEMRRPMKLAAGETWRFTIDTASTWFGRGDFAAGNEPAGNDIEGVIAANRATWDGYYRRIPQPDGRWSDDVRRLYFKAWTSVLYNTVEPSDMLFFDSKEPIGVCCKVAPTTMACCPATWESSLIALCVALVDAPLASRLMEAVFAPMEADGYLGEMPGNIRSSQLPVVEPMVAWACWKRTGDRAFLERVYPKLYANLLYKARHPTWMHHGPFMVRNLAYAHVGAGYVQKMAAVLGRGADETRRLEQVIDHTRRAVNAYWDEEHGYYRANFAPALGRGFGHGAFEEGTDAEALLPLCMEQDAGRRERLLKLLREQFLTESGLIRRRPRDVPGAMSGTWQSAKQHADFTLKESNLIVLLKAVKDLDRGLFDRLVQGTLSNIGAAGDFYECYGLDGKGRHNGPGSIFGAAAVIWAVLLSQDEVDGMYE